LKFYQQVKTQRLVKKALISAAAKKPAAYAKSDIILLDNPISVLDAHVRKAVFQEEI
jgi:hypothetical protein